MHTKLIDLVGKKFGKLTVVERLRNAKRVKWLCLCDCGEYTRVYGYNLRNGHTKSCGCLKIKHGHKRFSITSSTYISWESMIQRCTNPNHKHYRYYGGIGITVCDRWKNFEHFLMDMGLRPIGSTLDRINIALGYCPSNCRWADRKCQARNKRTNRFLTYEGITQCLQDWSRETGISTSAIRYRIDQAGWSIEKALTTPTHSTKNHHCGTTYDFYLSGGMRGYPELNYYTFNAIAIKLREMGYTVFNPAEYDGNNTFAAFMIRDLHAIIHECNGILLIPGWEESLGANAEAFVAFVCNKTTMMIEKLFVHGCEADFEIVPIDLTDYRLPYIKDGGHKFDPHKCDLHEFGSSEQ